MKYLPSAVADAELDIARAAYFGGEFAVYMTQTPAIILGEIALTASGAGTYTATPGSTIKTGGSDLQIVPITPINSSAALAISLAALDNSGTPVAVTGTASFTAPARSTNQTHNFARGYAQDIQLLPAIRHSTQRALATNIATITSPNHGYVSGQHVATTLFGVAAYNLADVVITVIDANHFTFPATGTNETTTADLTGTITPAGFGSLFTGITGLASGTPIVGGNNNIKLRVYQLPDVNDYELIQATTEIDFNTKDRVPKGIDAGMESDYWVKRGKAQPGELSIGSKMRSFTDGMARYSGQKCTCMLVGLKDGQTTTDRLVFTQYAATIKPKLPDGDGEATIEAAGKFVDHLFFIAP